LQHAASQGGSTAALVIAQNQLSRLGGLGRTVEHARGVGLANVRAEVTAMIVAAQATVQQARAAAAGGQAAELALHEAQAEAHRITGDFMRDFYERRIFDKYLSFTSTEDERAYRAREEARRIEIEKARAEGTPEGELRALDLQRAQLLDTGAHGGKDSPRFQAMLDENQAARDALANAMETSSPKQTRSDDLLAPTEAALVSPDLIEALRATGMTLADAGQGHGVSINQARESGTVRLA